jgi:hypothetical protein
MKAHAIDKLTEKDIKGIIGSAGLWDSGRYVPDARQAFTAGRHKDRLRHHQRR